MDKRPLQNDFVVETRGYCFLCLNQVNLQFCTNGELEGESMPHNLLSSLQCLSRHLKMDMRKVFNDNLTVPPHLLTEVERAKLKVELCSDCASVNDLFSKLYGQLDKIKMEIESCLVHIHEKLISGNNSGIIKQFQKKEGNMTAEFQHGKLQIVDTLRNEAIINCKREMSYGLPRIKVEKMNAKQITDYFALLKLQSSNDEFQPMDDWVCSPDAFLEESTFDISKVDISDVKEENFTPNVMDNNDIGDLQLFGLNNDNSDLIQKNNLEKLQTEIVPNLSFPKSERSNLTNSRRQRRRRLRTAIDPVTRQYKCNHCPLEFPTSQARYYHYAKAHFHRKEYKCSECGKVFLHKSHCNRHQQEVHQGIRYRCDLCERLFGQINNLRVHQLRTDCTSELTSQYLSSKRPCHCSLCGKKFEVIQELFEHLKSVHRQLLSQHECEVCGTKFKWKSALKRHLLNLHSRK